MSTSTLIVLAVIVVLVVWVISIYNGLVSMRQRVSQAFADVDVQLRHVAGPKSGEHRAVRRREDLVHAQVGGDPAAVQRAVAAVGQHGELGREVAADPEFLGQPVGHLLVHLGLDQPGDLDELPADDVRVFTMASRQKEPFDGYLVVADDGKISVAQSVVQKIAGIACREISGVHAMGVSTTRAYGAVRERIPGRSGPNVAQGVGVEVGETEAAIDLDIVVEYGVSIADLGRSIQRNVKQAVERMTGLDVVEVNINVDDLYLPGEDEQPDAPSRVA